MEYLFITITLWSTLTKSGRTFRVPSRGQIELLNLLLEIIIIIIIISYFKPYSSVQIIHIT